MGLGMGMMPMMAPMMPMGMNPMMAAAASATVPTAPTAPPSSPTVAPVLPPEQPEPQVEKLSSKEKLLKDLEAASAELSSKAAERDHDREPDFGTPSRPGPVSGSSRAATPPASSEPEPAEAAKADDEPPRCHLHPQRKPNAKCKFCQRAQTLSLAKAEKAAEKAEPEPKPKPAAKEAAPSTASASKGQDFEDYSRRTFNCSPMLKDQIFGSSYFKSLLAINSVEDLSDEIANYADTLDVYNAGSMVSPSCFICQVYRLFTLPQAEDLGELHAIIDHPDSALVRCAGFLYMRFVVPPVHLWEKVEEYLFDNMELKYADNGKQVMSTIGEFVEALLVRDRYFSTPLPRIPVKVRQTLEKELAPLQQFRKRMEANLRTFPKRVSDLPVEVYIDGDWVPGTGKEYVGRSSLRRKVRVQLNDGNDVVAHLGKVVLREGAQSDSGGEGGWGESRRRRSRSRGRRSPDWSRYKGRCDQDMVEELREKAKEDAVCGHGKAYARRPLTVEEELWKREPETRVSMLGDESRNSSYRRSAYEQSARESESARRRRQEEEDERQKRLRGIYEKYGSSHKAASSVPAIPMFSDVDLPDVLRLG
mmetsp:Transcript_35175/g.109811  ORF Transcript_35175/g.109811 Transcript_35175/m.109811 type:complete len:591 (-) Transcript_35175:74-1846(-)